jgi:hypothetical protein
MQTFQQKQLGREQNQKPKVEMVEAKERTADLGWGMLRRILLYCISGHTGNSSVL